MEFQNITRRRREAAAKYLTDASGFRGWAEEVLVPANETEVVSVIKEATRCKMPISVAGAGNGLTGGRVAQGGWTVSLENFNTLHVSAGSARVGAAMSLFEIQAAAKATGQFYAPDPTEIRSSIGGTIATNASGSRSFRYGSTRRHILALRVAMADGQVREFRRGDKIDFPVTAIPQPQTTKSTAGYPLCPGMDWIDLFCGSEGTLGMVLEAEIQLLPLPASLFAGVIFFASDDGALDAVDAWRSVAGLNMLEYVDENSLALIRTRFPEIPVHARAALLIEADGDSDVEHAWHEHVSNSAALQPGSWFASKDADRERFRYFRHSLPELVLAANRIRGQKKLGTDYAVPIARSREMLRLYHQRLRAAALGGYVIYGHLGDAHVHVNVLPRTDEEEQRATAVLIDLAKDVVRLQGTVSAEHGLGKLKAHLLPLQYTPEQIEAMKAVKTHLDPHWLLGRGTLLPFADAKTTPQGDDRAVYRA